jgi:hypothetical protein
MEPVRVQKLERQQLPDLSLAHAADAQRAAVVQGKTHVGEKNGNVDGDQSHGDGRQTPWRIEVAAHEPI